MMKAIILDRDGVINHDSADFIKTVNEWRALPGSLEAMARLTHAGYAIFIASNQSGIGRGLLSEADSTAIFDFLKNQLATLGGKVEGIVYCPHHPSDHCDCRKPLPGLFLQLRDRFQVDLTTAYAVGDSLRDIEAAIAAGSKPILVKTGNGLKTLALLQERNLKIPTYDDLAHFVEALLHD